MATKQCEHDWAYEHMVYQGRGEDGLLGDEVGVVRYCEKCGRKQMAFTSDWQAPPREYDLSMAGKAGA